MFLQLAHTKLNIYQFSEELVLECYKTTKLFPPDEKYAMVQQIRSAALSVHLNIAEGSSRKSDAERKRYFEIARGSVIEIDTAIEMAYKLFYINIDNIQLLGDLIIKNFR
jgi:four helix bundle protein